MNPEQQDKSHGRRDERKFVAALDRGLEILRCFTPDDGALGNHELAARTGLPRPTVTRLTYTLCELGYLSYSERLGKYRLGTGVLALGYAGLAGMEIRRRARPLMQQLADSADASVALGARDRLHMIYLEHCRGPGVMTLRLDVGSRIPMATTALGRAFLAGLPEAERGYLMDHLRERYGAQWPGIRAGIEQAIGDCAGRGFCLADGEWQPDVNAVAVPYVPPDGSDVVAFNCGGPRFAVSRERLLEEIGPRLMHLVHSLDAAPQPTVSGSI